MRQFRELVREVGFAAAVALWLYVWMMRAALGRRRGKA